MAVELDQVTTKTAKQLQSEALGKGLWRALWIAIAICLVWLVIEGGLRLIIAQLNLMPGSWS